MEIELGDKVRCKYSGFVGIVVAKTEFINGCVQYTITTKHPKSKEFIPPEEISIDEESLEIVAKKKKPVNTVNTVNKESTGGPVRKAFRQRGF